MAENDILARLADVEARNAIIELQARYAAFADAKYDPSGERAAEPALRAAARGQAECFTRDAEWEADDAFGGALKGRETLEEWFARPPWHFALHYYVAPQIRIDGDTAEARWRLWQVGVRMAGNQTVVLAGIAAQRLRHVPGEGWLIAWMRFEQTHIYPLAPKLGENPDD